MKHITLSVFIACILTSCASLRTADIVQNDSTYVEVKETVIYKDSIVYINIPVESDKAVLPPDDSSHLETSIAESDAYLRNGKLTHTLRNKSEAIRPVEIKVPEARVQKAEVLYRDRIIEKIVENRGMQDLIQRVEMPTEDVVEVKNGQRKVRTRKMFPGYVIVKMIITSESWYLIRNTQGVTGFVGHGSDPIPLTDEEVRHMGIEKVSFIIDVEPGDTVKVTDGPFDNFMGVVEDVNMEKQTLKVRISMFGRETPVELEFGQVEKIS